MKKGQCTAIILAAGSGTRMKADIPKLYLTINQKPVIYYTLKIFQDSPVIDNIILVVGEGQIEYVQDHIIEQYAFDKVGIIIEGGKERYDSVWQGLGAIVPAAAGEEAYVFIHDGARALLDEAIIGRAYAAVQEYGACGVGMPVKDTIKIADREGFVKTTPDRSTVWQIQTPQVFKTELILEAYRKYMSQEEKQATDDCMVVEQILRQPVKLVEGSYENVKITTPEDLLLAEGILQKRNSENM